MESHSNAQAILRAVVPFETSTKAILPDAHIYIPLDKLWLDKADVLQQLHISSRTLQNWRTKRILPFSRIHGKIFYKREDIVDLLNKGRSNR